MINYNFNKVYFTSNHLFFWINLILEYIQIVYKFMLAFNNYFSIVNQTILSDICLDIQIEII